MAGGPEDGTSALAELRRRARAWLNEHARSFENTAGRLSPFAPADPSAHAEEVRRARAWQAHKYAHGWAGLDVPVAYGGGGAPHAHAVVFAEEEDRFRLPLDPLSIGLGMVIPTLLRWGSEAQRRTFVPPVLNGSRIWCQLFSEPEAGSDLASVVTRAEPDGDGWRVRGRKVWTSHGPFADHGYLLARTDPEVPKHEGLSAFLIDMEAPGIEVRPLHQMTGGATFSEVLLDDVHVGADRTIGEPGDGWRVAMTTLTNERLAVTGGLLPFDELLALAEREGGFDDPPTRRRLTELMADRLVLDRLRSEQLASLREGEDPGAESSVAKVVMARSAAAIGQTAETMLGARAASDGPWTEYSLSTYGLRIGGGTEEILKNVLAERLLDLPREVNPDRGRPWSETRVGRTS